MLHKSLGEALGTFILVFIGCSSVAVSTLGMGLSNLWQVAIVWGIAVSLAIYAVRSFCPAHLNPAVSLAAYLEKKINPTELLVFSMAQLIGALIAGVVVYLVFQHEIAEYEVVHTIRSRYTARIFGEFFQIKSLINPQTDLIRAMFAEGIGTTVLVAVILVIGKTRRKIGAIAPLLIGLTVTGLILWLAPISQGGFNPARDFGPRLIAYFTDWGENAFPTIPYSFFSVYILSPLLGGILGSLVVSLLKRMAKF